MRNSNCRIQVRILSFLLKIKNKTYGNNILDIKYVYGVTLWLFFLTRTKRQENINITNCSIMFVVYFCNGYVGSNPVLTTNVIRLTAKNKINEEYHRRLQILMIYKGVNSIMTLNSKVAQWLTQ